MCGSTINSDGVPAQLIVPEDNKIILENGKEFEYDVLMLAPGMGIDFSVIEGLEEALKDGNCPVFSSTDFGTTRVRLKSLFNFSITDLWRTTTTEL